MPPITSSAESQHVSLMPRKGLSNVKLRPPLAAVLVVVLTGGRQPSRVIDDVSQVHGVLVVPALRRMYATATGDGRSGAGHDREQWHPSKVDD